MLALVHIHKTAGTTLDDILARSYGVRHCYVPSVSGKTAISAEDYQRIQKLCPAIDSIAGHSVSPYSDLETARPDIQYYTFLRDPLIRSASHYQYQVQQQGKTCSFEEWIARGVKRNPQTIRIAGQNATVKDAIRYLTDRFFFVGLVERFDESLVLLRQQARDARLDIWYRRRRVAESDEIKNRLLGDARTRALLSDANRLDLELYEFVSHELYPRFQRRYDGTLDSDVAEFTMANEAPGRLLPRMKLLANRYLSNRIQDLKRTVSYCT